MRVINNPVKPAKPKLLVKEGLKVKFKIDSSGLTFVMYQIGNDEYKLFAEGQTNRWQDDVYMRNQDISDLFVEVK